MSAAGGEFPKWVLLEPFVFRRDDDDDEFFPDETKAPIRAYGTTTWGADFRIAFVLAEPPLISRLYAQLPVPGFLDPDVADLLALLATHHHLALLGVATKTPTTPILQNFFIFNASGDNPSSSLKLLPPCTEPDIVGRRRRRPPPPPSDQPRLMMTRSMGLWCQRSGKEEEFVVAELSLHKPFNSSNVFANICFLCSPSTLSSLRWSSVRVGITRIGNTDDENNLLRSFQTDSVVPFRQWLCWIDYCRGILFCDLSTKEHTPTVSFLSFPLDEFPDTKISSSLLYRAVSVVADGKVLKFVNVVRHDGLVTGALKPDSGFTITCHTLVLGSSMVWEKDYKQVTSDELWKVSTLDRLPRSSVPMFPQVDVYRPHVVHLLFIKFGYVNKNMWVASIDMLTKTVESFYPYINAKEDLETDDVDLVIRKSSSPRPFIPCEFPMFLPRSWSGQGKATPSSSHPPSCSAPFNSIRSAAAAAGVSMAPVDDKKLIESAAAAAKVLEAYTEDMKLMITLRSSDGVEFRVEKAVAMESKTIRQMIEEDKCADKNAYPLPNVNSKTLSKVIQYYDKHAHAAKPACATNNAYGYALPAEARAARRAAAEAPTAEEQDLKNWDAELVKVDRDTLFDLVLAASYLNIGGLMDLTCQTVSDMMTSKPQEEIYKMLNTLP